MKNISWAKILLQQLFDAGVDEVMICPGARNAPFVEVLAHWESKQALHSFFEERSAGFFALGRIAQTERPKAVITTSGTAVANLLPSVVEAHYSGLPLVIISADRPKSYRFTGSPQTIVQPGLFTEYARQLGDLENGAPLTKDIDPRGPSHLNVCFDEPLIDEPVQRWNHVAKPFSPPGLPAKKEDVETLSLFAERVKRPLILVGGLSGALRDPVLRWLSRQNCPIYVESISGLRSSRSFRKQNFLPARKR